MKVLDLFSGIGGFSLGLERAGMETVAFCEIEPFCRKVLAKHWPSVPIYEDVRNVTAERLGTDGIGRIDVITGGFPCQDLSVAGKQAGIHAERSGLWGELCRIIGDVRPRYAIIENVTALISGGTDEYFPNDRCVCGWPYRRGGVHIPESQQEKEHICCQAGYRDDSESGGDIRGTEEDWRECEADEEKVKEMGSREMLDSLREGGGGNSEVGVSTLNLEEEASRILYRITDDVGRTEKASEWNDEMDRQGETDCLDDEARSSNSECEGAGIEGTGDCCEACGRPVAYESSRLRRARWFNRVLGDLAEIGYDCEWHCIPASELGAHHHRDRIWIIAYPQYDGCFAEQELRGNEATSNKWGKEKSEISRESEGKGRPADVPGIRGSQRRGKQRSGKDKGNSGEEKEVLANPVSSRQQGQGQHVKPLLAEAIKNWKTINAESGCISGVWATEPELGRVANGIPNRAHRLKGLGNAVVPQIPEIIGRAIMEVEHISS